MLVDLGRNDVGRVSEIGSVEVTELMAVERYSHVMHIVSNIQGTLAPGEECVSTSSGQLFPPEPSPVLPRSGPWRSSKNWNPSGAGFMPEPWDTSAFLGNMDTCITIRSILIKDGKAYVQAGGGIVADSDPEKEYEETLNKAQAIFKAIQLAEEGLS